jgi:hypothetical protein
MLLIQLGFTLCRVVSCMLLAAIIACCASNTNAVTLNATEDGLSLSGMFFSKLETMHAKLVSGDTGTVRSKSSLRSICMTHICRVAAVQIGDCVFIDHTSRTLAFGES